MTRGLLTDDCDCKSPQVPRKSPSSCTQSTGVMSPDTLCWFCIGLKNAGLIKQFAGERQGGGGGGIAWRGDSHLKETTLWMFGLEGDTVTSVIWNMLSRIVQHKSFLVPDGSGFPARTYY